MGRLGSPECAPYMKTCKDPGEAFLVLEDRFREDRNRKTGDNFDADSTFRPTLTLNICIDVRVPRRSSALNSIWMFLLSET